MNQLLANHYTENLYIYFAKAWFIDFGPSLFSKGVDYVATVEPLLLHRNKTPRKLLEIYVALPDAEKALIQADFKRNYLIDESTVIDSARLDKFCQNLVEFERQLEQQVETNLVRFGIDPWFDELCLGNESLSMDRPKHGHNYYVFRFIEAKEAGRSQPFMECLMRMDAFMLARFQAGILERPHRYDVWTHWSKEKRPADGEPMSLLAQSADKEEILPNALHCSKCGESKDSTTPEKKAYKHHYRLANQAQLNLCVLDTIEALDQFTARYQDEDFACNWASVAQDYDGVLVEHDAVSAAYHKTGKGNCLRLKNLDCDTLMVWRNAVFEEILIN